MLADNITGAERVVDVVGFDQILGHTDGVSPVRYNRVAVDACLQEFSGVVVPDDGSTADVATELLGVAVVVVAKRDRHERLPETPTR